jgi:arabinofuranan 3-O-arabinosyltransferase
MRNRTNDGVPSTWSRPQSAGGNGKPSWFPALLAIEDRIFTGQRLRFYGTGILVAYAVLIAWAAPRLPPKCVDFGRIWLSGVFAGSEHPLGAYDYRSFAAAQRALFGDGCLLFHFPYPPTFLLFTFPLGLMPYRIAFAAWNFATLALYATAAYAILPRRGTIILALTPLVVLINLDIGQNGCLTAALIGLSLVSLERRPRLSGLWLGLLSYKPHFGILFPFALLASRNWRTLACAGVVAAALAGLATMAFGQETWGFFIDAVFNRNPAALNADGGVSINLFSVYGLLRWTGANVRIAWAGHLAVAVSVILATSVLWAKPIPHSLKAAAFCAGSLMITPYVQYYDFCILPIATTFLVKEGLTRGFLPGERSGLLICFVGEFLMLHAPYMFSLTPLLAAVIIIFVSVGRRAAIYAAAPASLPHPIFGTR